MGLNRQTDAQTNELITILRTTIGAEYKWWFRPVRAGPFEQQQFGTDGIEGVKRGVTDQIGINPLSTDLLCYLQ